MKSLLPASVPRFLHMLRPSPRLVALGLAVALGLGTLWWFTATRSAFEAAEAREVELEGNDRLALAHEQQARAVLRTLDQALQSVIDDPALVEGLLAGQARVPRHLVLRGIRIGLADTSGRQAGDDADLPTDWAEDLVGYHRRSDPDLAYVQIPARQSSGPGWVTTLSRPLRDGRGKFIGVIYARMDPRVFLEFFEKASLGPADVIVLVGEDGRVRARRAGPNYSYDDSFVNSRLLQEATRTDHGHFVADSPIDGARRFYSFRRLPEYALIALVGTSEADVMAPVRERTHRYQAIAAAGTLLMVGGALAVVLAIRRHDRAARELRRSETRFRALTEMSADWFWETDDQFRLREIVRAQRYAKPGGVPVKRLAPWDLPGAQGDAAYWAAHRAVLERHERFADFEMRRIDRSGRLHVALISGEPVFDGEGRFLGYRGVGRDVSEHRAAEAARRSSEGRLAGIIESAMDAIITVDASHRIVVFNAAAAEMFRCTPQQALGQPLEKLMPARFRHAHGAQVRQFGATRVNSRAMGRSGHIWALRADGQEFPADASISHIEIDGAPLYSVVLRDITARLAAEGTLRDREESYRLLFENNLDGVLLADDAGAIDRANPAAARLLGLSMDALQRAGLAVLRGPGNPLDLLLDECRRNGQARGKFNVLRPDGGTTHLEVAFAAYVDSAGRHRSSVLLHDVSERHQAHAAQEALASQLRQSQKMEALGSIAGGIAHDFNNVIAAILGNARLAADNLARTPVASVYLQEIERAGLRARELVKRIMTFSRRQPAVFVRQPIGPVVREAVALLRSTLPSGVTISLRGDDAPLDVLADATQLHQVVMNLGTNAWQAMGQRAGRIDIGLERAPGQDQVVLSVQDSGSGMDADTQARIFEPFFTTKPDGEGTGLGLAVVHGIVLAHQGTIEVTSAPGHGCRFDIRLPLAEPAGPQAVAATAPATVLPAAAPDAAPTDAAAPDAAPTDAAAGSQAPAPAMLRLPAPTPAVPVAGERGGAPRHVVYVDDYDAMVAMVRAVLEAQGLRVSGFDSSPAAQAFIQAHAQEIDLLITDYNMPELSGLDLARAARALRPDLPVIVASGHLSADLRAGAQQVGIDCLFDKPAGIDELCRRVDQLLAA